MGEVLLGTSGWSYAEWVGVFYPSSKTKKLSHYSGVFETVEIDSTFYAYPSEGMVHGWERNTPPGFVFSAKLPKAITHDKRLDVGKGVVADLYRYLDLMKPLIKSGKMGPFLVQLPPSFTFEKDYGRLRGFVDEAPRDVMLAVEFRHLSWLKKETDELLSRYNIANTVVDEPLLPPEARITADFSVVRWHGKGTRPWYNYRYTDGELDQWKPRLDEISKKTKKVYGYFNNHFHGFAIENALKTLEMTGKATAEQKKVLVKATNFLDGGKGEEAEGREPSLLRFLGEDGAAEGRR